MPRSHPAVSGIRIDHRPGRFSGPVKCLLKIRPKEGGIARSESVDTRLSTFEGVLIFLTARRSEIQAHGLSYTDLGSLDVTFMIAAAAAFYSLHRVHLGGSLVQLLLHGFRTCINLPLDNNVSLVLISRNCNVHRQFLTEVSAPVQSSPYSYTDGMVPVALPRYLLSLSQHDKLHHLTY